jgi:acetyl esterase
MIDVAEWITASGKEHGWDGARLALSGISAGAKFALNICQYRAAHGLTPPRAVALVVPVTDVVRTDRTSRYRRAAISPFIQRFVQWAYMPDPTRRSEPLASPRYDPALAGSMPPTIIQTGELDTLAAEGRELARLLADHGVEVTLHQVPGGDHSMYATREVLGVLNRIRVFFAHRI